MSNKLSRRKVVKSIAGLTIGMEMMNSSIANAIPVKEYSKYKFTSANIKVSPPGPKSLALLERIKKSVARTNYTGLYSISASSGKGVHIIDLDGNSYIDCLAAASTNILGYDHDEVVDAYTQTAKAIQNTAFGYTPNIESVELAEKLIKITPGDFDKRVMLGVSGSDASGGAIEAARKYTGKMGLISFNYAYHGSTGLSQQASGFSGLKTGVYQDSNDFIKLDFPATLKQRDKALKDIESVLAWGKVGAVMLEPIQGDAGIIVPAEGFMVRLKNLLEDYGVLLIDDEVQSGMGRSGKWWAIEHEVVVPDIVVVGKGLSGGYAPVSAIIGRVDIMESLDTAQQIFTYTGHGPSAAAASKVIDIIMKEDIVKNAADVGAYLLSGLQDAVKKYPEILVEARGKGLMIGLEINTKNIPLANKIFAFRCIEKGIYFGYFGPGQRVIRIEPPLTLSKGEADTILKVVNETAAEIKGEKIPDTTVAKVKNYALGW
ncbi:MAG: aminotransferase class III-fold pyridoxal phosphate-dependent enzyme [Cyclobacteriaceae bacterium]